MRMVKQFLSEALNAWRAKARCNVVPAERVQELFHELQFNPSERQISEMLQTAKMFARKGSRQWHGLTFGEFCVLAADLKRFRTSSFTPINEKLHILNARDDENDMDSNPVSSGNRTQRSRHKSTKVNDQNTKSDLENNCPSSSAPSPNDTGTPVEVFLGGSCNPTTWRKDVAIPALESLGISFYNPQVSDWTPDLIELEHRAKEKARVLFFVMDSETRASAGAIEAAHIAGQNCQQLVLVLHPYKPDQFILNEPLSHQEYIDLTRNQQMLRELVTRRGLPVLDNIPSGLQRTKEILAGIRDPPSNIASILIVVRGAFDRVNAMKELISLEQCQRALSILGYAQSLLTIENLKSVILSQRESLDMSPSSCMGIESSSQPAPSASAATSNTPRCKNFLKKETTTKRNEFQIDFDQFCILAAYLSVLQQEIHESGCISPIKGTNVPPPPVYLANLQGFHCRPGDDNITINFFTKHVFKTSSSTSVPGGEERHSDIGGSRNRDSGTSSPQPSDSMMGVVAKSRSTQIAQCSKMLVNYELMMSINSSCSENNTTEEESDSNDSVFSSSDSSINSIHCSGDSAFSSFEIRDVYLGGSCFLRTKWRQDYAMPYFKSKKITFHLPALHESIQPSQLDLPDKSFEDSNSQGGRGKPVGEKLITGHLLRKMEREKAHNSSHDSTNDHVESTNWPLNIRPNLYNPSLMDSSRVLLFVITNETRSLAPMTLAAHSIGLMYNVVLCVQMLPENCVLGQEKLTPTAIKDYNRGRSYLIDLAKRQGVPVFNDLKSALECTAEKIKALKFQKNCQTNDITSEEKKGMSCPQ
ncbi:uncharacterized protein LOC129916072 isoform X2 [Episyrphus balteatus]|uniref:uncharacterized protein LOC129916072 isoform X2 n=1 Tax=Episyrphus balteatus TaxID=286459 RepID=UPI002485663B|nr:uncharacterized protein LOC129916072 isoform X2 [Episyrphus balteatus]